MTRHTESRKADDIGGLLASIICIAAFYKCRIVILQITTDPYVYPRPINCYADLAHCNRGILIINMSDIHALFCSNMMPTHCYV